MVLAWNQQGHTRSSHPPHICLFSSHPLPSPLCFHLVPSLQLAIVDSKAHPVGRSMHMVLAPNKPVPPSPPCTCILSSHLLPTSPRPQIVESKVHLEGRSMHMVLAPNKAALQRIAAAEEKSRRTVERSKRSEMRGGAVSGSESEGEEGVGESDGESDGEEMAEGVREQSGLQ
ncbi:unnamed protein product [Closterium sp. NIES-53]